MVGAVLLDKTPKKYYSLMVWVKVFLPVHRGFVPALFGYPFSVRRSPSGNMTIKCFMAVYYDQEIFLCAKAVF